MSLCIALIFDLFELCQRCRFDPRGQNNFSIHEYVKTVVIRHVGGASLHAQAVSFVGQLPFSHRRRVTASAAENRGLLRAKVFAEGG